jgi:prepilin-type processing-associated H-X9-DG protein
MTQSTPTLILPYIEQNNVYNQMDHTLTRAQMGVAPYNYTLTTIHAGALGAVYNDPNFPNTNAAARTLIKTFNCPSAAVSPESRSPDRYGTFDYMFISVSDIEDGRAGSPAASTPVGTRPTDSARRVLVTVGGMLTCDGGRNLGQVQDGTSNTILIIEDAGRAHPSISQFGAYSTRPSPITTDPQAPGWQSTPGGSVSPNGRRMYAWADPDCATNGLSGPSNAGGDRTARVNNYANPVGGPTTGTNTCPWSTNNCGPNDEPFSFHTGGVNAAMGDGSVRFIRDNTPPLTLKWMVGVNDGQVFNID